MDRKVLAITLLMLIVAAAFLTPGCADKKSPAVAGPTVVPTPSPTAGIRPTAQPSAAPPELPARGPSGTLTLDPSIINLSGEGMDEGGFPETGLPTPTLD